METKFPINQKGFPLYDRPREKSETYLTSILSSAFPETSLGKCYLYFLPFAFKNANKTLLQAGFAPTKKGVCIFIVPDYLISTLTRKIHSLKKKKKEWCFSKTIWFDAALNWCTVWPIYDLFLKILLIKFLWVQEGYKLPSMWQAQHGNYYSACTIQYHNSGCRDHPEDVTFYSMVFSNKSLDAHVYMLKHTGKHVRKLLLWAEQTMLYTVVSYFTVLLTPCNPPSPLVNLSNHLLHACGLHLTIKPTRAGCTTQTVHSPDFANYCRVEDWRIN